MGDIGPIRNRYEVLAAGEVGFDLDRPSGRVPDPDPMPVPSPEPVPDPGSPTPDPVPRPPSAG